MNERYLEEELNQRMCLWKTAFPDGLKNTIMEDKSIQPRQQDDGGKIWVVVVRSPDEGGRGRESVRWWEGDGGA